MRFLPGLTLFLTFPWILPNPASGLPSESMANYTLVWSDEFAYTGLPDGTKWGYDVGGGGWGNNELQYYTSGRLENARVEDGRLIIEARKESYGGRGYTSARLVTRNKGDWLYGRMEIRAKLPAGRGTWPAIWMLPTDWAYGGWPDSGEIDIMEHVGYDMQRVHGTIHTNDFNHMLGTQIGSNIVGENVDTEFHEYALEWRPDRIDVFMDGLRYFTVTDNGTGYGAWPFDKRFHLIMNIAIGGNWGGIYGVDDSVFPQRLEVDYVRVYSIDDYNYAPPAEIPGRIEVEEFSDQYGIRLQETGDVDGEVNSGYMAPGDWVEFRLKVPTTGTYALDLRQACPSGLARVEITAGENSFITAPLPSTGGWQNWATSEVGELELPQGEHTLRLTINSPSWEDLNLNWIRLRLVRADPDEDPDGDGFANFWEEALGLDLFNPDPASRWPQTTVVDSDGESYAALSYRRRTGGSGSTGTDYSADGYAYRVEVSPDLQPGSWESGPTAVVVAGLPVDNGDGSETVTVRALAPLSGGPRFLRLVVTETP